MATIYEWDTGAGCVKLGRGQFKIGSEYVSPVMKGLEDSPICKNYKDTDEVYRYCLAEIKYAVAFNEALYKQNMAYFAKQNSDKNLVGDGHFFLEEFQDIIMVVVDIERKRAKKENEGFDAKKRWDELTEDYQKQANKYCYGLKLGEFKNCTFRQFQ